MQHGGPAQNRLTLTQLIVADLNGGHNRLLLMARVQVSGAGSTAGQG